MNIYIDESNVTPHLNDIEKNYFICAAGIATNKKLIKAVIRIKKKYGIKDEIKGSDLYRKTNTKLRKKIVQTILPLIKKGLFILEDYYLDKANDITSSWGPPIKLKKQHIDFEIKWHIHRKILCSDMAINCKKDILKFREPNYLSDLNESVFFKNINEKINQRQSKIKDFENHSSIMLEQYKNTKLKTWVENVNNDNDVYKIIQKLVFSLSQKINVIDKIIIDYFKNKKEQNKIKEMWQSAFKFYKPNTNVPEVVFEESKNSIGIQVADWLVAIARKTAEDLLNNFFRNNYKKQLFGSTITYGNELLRTWRLFKDVSIVGLTFPEMAFLEWARINIDIERLYIEGLDDIILSITRKEIKKELNDWNNKRKDDFSRLILESKTIK